MSLICKAFHNTYQHQYEEAMEEGNHTKPFQ